MTTSNRPKGALTYTARQSRRSFVLNVALAAFSFILLIAADDVDWTYWVRIAVTLLWATLAVLYFRSWRILLRRDDDAAPSGS